MEERSPEEAKKIPTSQHFGTYKEYDCLIFSQYFRLVPGRFKIQNNLLLTRNFSIGLDESIRQDVEFIKKAPFLRKDVLVLGYALDIDTGLLRKVA